MLLQQLNGVPYIESQSHPLLFHDESVMVHIKCMGGGGVGLICMLLI